MVVHVKTAFGITLLCLLFNTSQGISLDPEPQQPRSLNGELGEGSSLAQGRRGGRGWLRARSAFVFGANRAGNDEEGEE